MLGTFMFRAQSYMLPCIIFIRGKRWDFKKQMHRFE